MTSEQTLLGLKISQLLYMILVDIRLLALNRDPGVNGLTQIVALTDIAHNLPRYQMGLDDMAGNLLREALVSYAKSQWPNTPPEKTRYLRVLDMSEADFEDQYMRKHWAWPSPVETKASA